MYLSTKIKDLRDEQRAFGKALQDHRHFLLQNATDVDSFWRGLAVMLEVQIPIGDGFFDGAYQSRNISAAVQVRQDHPVQVIDIDDPDSLLLFPCEPSLNQRDDFPRGFIEEHIRHAG